MITLLPVKTWAQSFKQIKLEGRVKEQGTHKDITDAVISCLFEKDSSIAGTGITDSTGTFWIDNLDPGNYLLYIRRIGFKSTFLRTNIPIDENSFNIGTVTMQRNDIMLTQVEIKGVRNPLTIKKDTLEFNATYFKTRENSAVEDLLKKIPGIEIDANGIIKVNGETIRKITIDGRSSFTNGDPKDITRNLQADLIDKIQLIERRADQRDFSEYGDGKPDRVINITIKKNKINQLNGEITAAYGTENRFAAKTTLSRFNPTQQAITVGTGDNINGETDNYNGGGAGFTKNWNAGISYNQEFNKKTIVSGSYKIADNTVNQSQNSKRQNFINDSSNYYNQQNDIRKYTNTHQINLRIDQQLDSMQKITLDNQIGIYKTANNFEDGYQSLGEHLQKINYGQSKNSSIENDFNNFTKISYDKRFNKQGRYLGITISYGTGQSETAAYAKSSTIFPVNSGTQIIDSIDQYNITKSNAHQVLAMISYIEPIFKNKFIQLTFGEDRLVNPLQKNTYNYNHSSNSYDLHIDSLSIGFKSISNQHYGKISIRGQENKYNYTISLAGLIGSMNNKISTEKQTSIYIASLLPEIFFNYAPNIRSRISFIYRQTISVPELFQLTPIPDNSNPLYIKVGNPDLKQSKSHMLQLGYNSFNPISLSNISILITSNINKNQITNSISSDSSGRQIIQPVNMNGIYNLSSAISSRIPFEKDRSYINTNTNISINRLANKINNDASQNTNLQISQAIDYNYRYKELIDFIAAGVVTYNNTKYKYSTINNIQYFNYSLSFNGNLSLPHNFNIGCSIRYTWTTGLSSGFNTDNTTLNIYISKSLFQNKQGFIKLQTYDLANKNTNISRITGDNYVEDIENSVLKRFFMLRFSYYLGKGKEK